MAQKPPQRTSSNIKSHNTLQNRQRFLVSMLESRFFMVFAFVFAGVALAAIVGFYQHEKNGISIFLRGDTTPAVEQSTEGASPEETTGAAAGPTPAQSAPAGTSSGQAGAPPRSSNSACGSTSMPEGVCTAVLDVEKNSLKNSSYVAVDTSQIPDGTSVIFKKDTWAEAGANTGTVDATLTYAAQPYNIRVSLAVRDGVWKVTSYTSN